MKDPKRIDELLETVKSIWEKSPDLRLLQLLINSLINIKSEYFYYLEDKELIESLNKYYNSREV